MNITFHGHSCFEIEHENHRLIIDPFLTGNPVAKKKAGEVKVDYILVTHGHGDHVGDTVAIAKQNDATVISTHELATWLDWQGVKSHGMAIGGSYTFDFGRVKVTPAWHSSGMEMESDKQILYMGTPAGFLLTLGDKRIYHAGDTALFSDMKLISMHAPIDLALLPIGDNYTMGPEDALIAAEWLQAKHVIPMHVNTFSLIKQDTHAFARALAEKGIQGKVLEVGESWTL